MAKKRILTKAQYNYFSMSASIRRGMSLWYPISHRRNVHAEHGDLALAVFVVERLQLGVDLSAGNAPGGPEIEDDERPFEVGQAPARVGEDREEKTSLLRILLHV